jgi:uncharacterized protein YndB with AHSA1/START domain
MSTLISKASTSIHASTEKVWDALTNPEIVKQYFFGTNQQSDWKPGSDITWTGEWEGKAYQDKGKILDIIPGKRLQYTYYSSMSGEEDKPENYRTVTFELSGSGNTTELTITQDNNKSEESRAHSEQNWNMILDAMKKLLEANN